MKIGLVTTWFERGAAYVSRQYRDVLEPEHEVAIYARGGERRAAGDPNWDGENVTWGKSIATHGNTAFRLTHFRHWLRREKPACVIFNEQQWWPPVLLCRDLGIRSVGYVDYYTEQTVPLFANYDLLLCHTRRHESVFDWHPGCTYIPWGTSPDVFQPRPRSIDAAEPLTFFHSAGHNPLRKGSDLLLEAFARVDAPATLLIHSQTDLKHRLPQQAALIRRLQEQSRLEIHVGDVAAPGLYHRGDVYVYPTRLEGLGLTVAESLACGLPLIIPDCAPMIEMAPEVGTRRVSIARQQPRSDGYYWPQAIVDVDDLRRQIEWFIANRADLPAMQDAARRHALRFLNWGSNAQRLGSILSGLRTVDATLSAPAYEAARRFEAGRQELAFYFPLLARLMRRCAPLVRPLAARYSERR